MNVDRLRAFLLTLPHVVETVQFGDNLVFWVGDKAIGGKMFALLALDADVRRNQPILSFPVGPLAFADLLEVEGLVPAPYLARIHWVAATHWEVFNHSEWQAHLRQAHAMTLAKLPPKVLAVLALPPVRQRRAIAERRRLLAAKKVALQHDSALKH